jgi:hypothetical protein
MPLPPHSLHRDFRRSWMHMSLPQHSFKLHRDFRRLWVQMLLPPLSLHRDFCRPWMQVVLLPPRSLFYDFCRPIIQAMLLFKSSQFDSCKILLPSNSLHRDFPRLSMHMHASPQSLLRDLFLVCMQVDVLSCISTFWRSVRPGSLVANRLPPRPLRRLRTSLPPLLCHIRRTSGYAAASLGWPCDQVDATTGRIGG